MSDKYILEGKKAIPCDDLIKWGKSFWKDTQSRIQEITNNFESKVKSAFKTKGIPVGTKLENFKNTIEEAQSLVIEC